MNENIPSNAETLLNNDIERMATSKTNSKCEINPLEVAGVVIAFLPSKENIIQLIETCKVFKNVYLVNNSPEVNIVNTIVKLNLKLPLNLIIYDNPTNLGIAQALNLGISLAQKELYNWVVTLDQDSKFTSECLNKMTIAYSVLNDENIASINPLIINHGQIPTLNNNDNNIDIDSCITSGNLLNIKAWQMVGGFEDSLFIDWVDYELSLRLRKYNYRLIQANSARLNHELGEVSKFKLFNHYILHDIHSPIRIYYISRNNFYILSNYLFKFPKDCLKTSKDAWVKKLVKTLIFQDNKVKNLKMISSGLWDGIRGKYGKYES